MPEFIVAGPFDVPLVPNMAAKLVDGKAAKSLFTSTEGFLRKGCYVFGVRAGKGAKPIYVGMTQSQILVNEAFNDRNINIINRYINGQRGLPIIYIVYQRLGKGNPAKNCISEIEDFLVGRCAKRNAKLVNIHMNKKASW